MMRLLLIILLAFMSLVSVGQDSFYMIEESDSPGSNISIPVSVTGFENIISLQGSIAFDPSVLSFSNISNFNLSSLSISNFGLTQTGLGIITYSWYDASLNGETLSDSSLLFALDFNVSGFEGQSCSINFSSSPTLQEVVDSSLNIKTTIYNGMIFQIDNILSQEDKKCEHFLYPNIITKNNPVYFNTCENNNEIIIYSSSGKLNFKDYKILEDRIYFYSKGLFFVHNNNVVKKILVL